jgi:signal peptide peptidase-like protein 3
VEVYIHHMPEPPPLSVLGSSLCVLMIQFMRVPSLKLSTFLLLALLAYDVFWVFCSSSIFNQNVMIAVATKKAVNPVSQSKPFH